MAKKCIKWGRSKSRRVCKKFSGGKKAASKKAAPKTGGKKVCVQKKKVWSDVFQTNVSRCAKFAGGKAKKTVTKSKGKRKGKSKGRAGVVSFMTKDGPVTFRAKKGARLDPSFEGIMAGY
jgi:hypothetical protein